MYCSSLLITGQVGCKNLTGLPYQSHYDICITSELVRLRIDIQWEPSGTTVSVGTDPLAFAPTTEVFGVGPIPDSTCLAYGFQQTNASDRQPTLAQLSTYPFKLPLLLTSKLSGTRGNRYEFLATAQGTRIAVTSVHTPAEYKKFNDALAPDGTFPLHGAAKSAPDFAAIARWWSQSADGKTIFYKFPQNLETHFKQWKDRRDELTSLSLTQPSRRAHQTRITGSTHHAQVLKASTKTRPTVPADSEPEEPAMGSISNGGAQPTTSTASTMTSHHPIPPSHEPSSTIGSDAVDRPPQRSAAPLPTNTIPTAIGLALPAGFGHGNGNGGAPPSMPFPFQMGVGPYGFIAFPGHPPPQVLMNWGGGRIPGSAGPAANEPRRRSRRCMVCVSHGREGRNCPGNNDRSACTGGE